MRRVFLLLLALPLALVVSACLSTGPSTPSGSGYEAPRTAEQLASLNGGQASSVDGNLRQWGFRDVDGFTSGNTRYTIWYNPATRQCVQMTTADGRAVDVRDIQTHDNCR